MGGQTRERNPNWRGGRSLASNGYVLVRVGVGHHLADVRGYAYEHRVVAEAKIGRRLLPGEQIHHVDGNRQNNDPCNLDVVSGVAEHRLCHRRAARGLRRPGEPNPLIACACGCGVHLEQFDAAGRPRRFVTGHNPRPSPSATAILAALGNGPRTRAEIAAVVGTSVKVVATALSKLRRARRVTRLSRGVWALIREDQ